MLRCVKSSDLLRLLSRKGATILTGRGKGSHVVVRFNDRQTTVPQNRDLPIGTLKAILKQLNLTLEDLASG
jgi:predicted RNA binding protein YcfA (HicA-like mRNA interferase family)